MHYKWYEYVVAFGAIFVFIAWIAFEGTRLANWLNEKNSPKDSPDVLVQQMYADNVNVNRDPTIPVGDFNPKHVAHREIGRR